VVQHRLLEIAIDAFGQHGLDGASTRDIAAAAGTAMSSITYHYGGKEGLYLAAADEVAQQMGDLDSIDDIDGAIVRGDPDEARAMIKTILCNFLARLQHERSNSWALFIMREQLNPTEAFERIYAGPMGHTARSLVELICIATGAKDREAARLATISLFGQVLVMKAARATCRKLLERETLTPDLIHAYSARVTANADAILDRMIQEQQGDE
jgi:AcrR family transcriptional regulator